MKIEICLAVYQRRTRLPELIDQLKTQTNQNFNLNIWNNSGKKLNTNDFPEDRLMIFESDGNVGSIGRFKLVPHTKGKCIIFIDDDLELQEDFVEYMYNCWEENPDDLQGWFTRVFKTSYWDSIPYNKEDTEVDYVGTGGMILSRDIFEKEPSLLNPPKEFIKVEDLYLSYIARKNGMKLYAVEPHCKIISDGKDQYTSLLNYKDEAYFKLKELGWKTINDRY
jgi:GT2 family glycosyltransferase